MAEGYSKDMAMQRAPAHPVALGKPGARGHSGRTSFGDVSLIFDMNHTTESAVQSSWMNARVSAELLSGVGAGGGEAHGTGDSGGLDMVRSSAKIGDFGGRK